MNSQTVAKPVNIRDYFLDKDPKTYSGVIHTYEVKLQNNTDFIISRKTGAGDRELVILISRGLFYIKEVKSGNIYEATSGKLKTFLKDLNDDSIKLDQVLWLPEINKHSAERLLKIISNDTFTDMCRHNLLAEIENPGWYAGFWLQNQKLFIKLHSIFPTISDNNGNKYRSALPIIFELDKRYGYNEAMHFAETLLQSGIEQFTAAIGRVWDYNPYGCPQEPEINGFFQLLEDPYNLNLRRLIEYIMYDAYSQGISQINGYFWNTYKDYLDMQIKIFGKIREKYPSSMKTECDILVLKVRKAELIANCDNFTVRSSEISGLAYSSNVYSIVVPDCPEQIADEGINLSHCVGSYIDRIINGECHILFLRKTRSPDLSLVTLQLSKGRVVRAEGYRCRKITGDERKFLNDWGCEKHIQIAV